MVLSSNPPITRVQPSNIRSTDENSGHLSASDSLPYLVTNANIATPPQQTELVRRFYLQSLSRELLPDERVAECLRKLIPIADVVPVMHSPGNHSAHYQGLIVCARIWICPVCASKITERRRQELTWAVQSSDFAVLLTTYTLRHNQSHTLEESLTAILDTYRGIKAGSHWGRTKKRIAWVGEVRALEVTYGTSGWHPHIHVLTLLEQPLTADGMEWLQHRLKARWLSILKNSGFTADWHYAVDVRTGTKAIAEYIAKYGRLPKKTGWTLEHEMTKQPVKRGKWQGATPMQLLEDYGNGDDSAGDLYIEYATQFKGRHQLQWSRGLRKLLGLDEEQKTDEQLAKEDMAAAAILAILSRDDWRVVLGNDARAELLDVAASGSFELIEQFLHRLGIETVYRPEYLTEQES